MAEYLLTIAGNDVRSVVKAAFPHVFQPDFDGASTPYYLVETMDTRYARSVLRMPTYVIMDRLTPDIDFTVYPTGRVFDRSGEVKWQKSDDAFQIVYLGERLNSYAGALECRELAEPHYHRREPDNTLFLWGRKISPDRIRMELGFEPPEDNIFLELQIPQYLKYPVEANDLERAQLVVREWDTASGEPGYYRFMDLKRTKRIEEQVYESV